MAFLNFLTGRAVLRDETETLRARVSYLLADNERLRAELADRKARTQRVLAALHVLVEHLETCPPADPAGRLLADLHECERPSASPEGPTSPATPTFDKDKDS